MNFCPHCGAKLGQASRFCTNCGAPLTPVQAAPQKSALASDPSLVSNIIFFALALLFLLIVFAVEVEAEGEAISDNWEFLLVSFVLGIFAFLPSYDHVNTRKMNLLKTVEAFGLSLAALVCCFFFADNTILLGFLLFACVFSLLVVLKIRKIPDSSRNTCEKVVYAFSLILFAFSLLMALIGLSNAIN